MPKLKHPLPSSGGQCLALALLGNPERLAAQAPQSAVAGLQRWLDEARSCGIRAVEAFVVGLEQDAAAVRAALIAPWSSGQAEGQINKLKLLNRQTYGRASFELLRRRILLAA